MNRAKLKAYAPKARREFIQAVTDRAAYYGLTNNKPEPIIEKGDVAIIAGKAFPRVIAAKRKRLEERIGQQGFEQVMEAMAYTWFNRFAAIRFMELHGYLDHGYRVLSHPEGKTTPEIIEHAEHVDLPGLDREKVIELKIEGTREPELYGMLLIAQCNALHKAMPFLFEKIDDETELLLPENLLHSDSLIRKLVNEVPEEEWKDIEIIGWLYQFYISEKKDQVIGKMVKSEDIPAATQLFTPNWIVKYMVQNTLGRQWLATYPDSQLKGKMEYYIEPAEQTPEVLEQLKAITPKSLNPEELTFLDPATGSGHILVEAYDIFKAIYQERGYRAKDITKLILEKNLFGLEIDDRAAQLAAFALMMKARADDRRIFDSNVQPHVQAIQESKGIDAQKITEALNTPILKMKLPPREFLFEEIEEEKTPLFTRSSMSIKGEISEGDIAQLIALFEQGKTFGSLIRVPEELAEKLNVIVERVNDVLIYGDMHGQAAAKLLMPFVQQARPLARNYDAVVTNPPYMGSKFLNSLLRNFAYSDYPTSKSDLFAFCVERFMNMAKINGRLGFMTPFTWMFLTSYEGLRSLIINHNTIVSLIQPEYHAFFESAYVPICTFTLQNTRISGYVSNFIKLSDFYGENVQPQKTLEAIKDPDCGWHYIAKPDDFRKIPGTPIAYWISDKLKNLFKAEKKIGEYAYSKQGLATADNDRFLRKWHEVSISKLNLRCFEIDQTVDTNKKWFPHQKGGFFRRWYGNNEYVINWQKNGAEIRAFGTERGRPRSRVQNSDFYFKSGITWSDLTIAKFAGRHFSQGFIFDITGPALFTKVKNYHYKVISYVNSKVFQQFLDVSLSGMHYSNGVIAEMPCLVSNGEINVAEQIAHKAININKYDWDSYETSWDFSGPPLLHLDYKQPVLKATYARLRDYHRKMTLEMKQLEEENNRIFIDAYGLQDELKPEVPLSEITLTCNPRFRYGGERSEEDLEDLLQADTMKEIISYAIGCMMGRYSLDKPGLIYAHNGNEGFDPSQYHTFPADEDGITPLTENDWFEVDAANRVVKFIGVAWPKEHLEENLTFVAESLGQNQGESPRETIRRYLAAGFFKHHLSMYKKRPIYWLFSSGKLRAFQSLVYLHRYNEGTLSRMRTDYVIPLQGKMSARIDQLSGDIISATATSHRKKLEKEKDKLVKQLAELRTFDEKLRHYADLRISLDLDDGVKVNYGKFGDLLAEMKAVTGTSED